MTPAEIAKKIAKKNPELAKKLEEASKDTNECLEKKREGTKCEVLKAKL